MHKVRINQTKSATIHKIDILILFATSSLSMFFSVNDMAAIIASSIFFSILVNLSISASQDLSLNLLRFLSFLLLTLFLTIHPIFSVLIALLLTFSFGNNYKTIAKMLGAKLFRICLLFFIALNLVYGIGKKYTEHILQFLTFGYDNAFHFSLFRQFNLSGHFHYPFSDSGWSDFGLFKSYPTGQAAIFSTLSKTILNSPKGYVEELSAFFTLILICFFLVYVFSMKILSARVGFLKNRKFFLVPVLIAAVFVFPGVILVNGFPPYLLGLIIILIFLFEPSENEDFHRRSQRIGSTILLLSVICPAGLFFLISAVAIFSMRLVQALPNRDLRKDVSLAIAQLIFYFTISLLILNATSSKVGWRQIYAGGGVQPPNLIGALAIFLLSVSLLIRFYSGLKGGIFFHVFLSGTIGTGILIAITIFFTGDIQYYAIKQLYLWGFLASLFICFVLNRYWSDLRLYFKGFAVLVILISLLFTMLVPKVFLGGFMGTPLNAIKHTLQSESWSSEVVDGRSIYERAKLANRTNQDCLIMISRGGESDLNSRWLNSLDSDGLVTEACFAMYWNTSNMTLLDRITLASQSGLRLSIYVPKEVFDLSDDNLPNNVTVLKY
jgi:hypothetical protein